MHIHQLSVNYLQEQDRILARINTTGSEEFRLWFTRRLSQGLWPMLQRAVAQQVAQQALAHTPGMAAASADPQTQQMLADFKRQESLQKADFRTPYQEQAAALPLGPEPLLVTEVNITPLPSGQLQMHFQEQLPNSPAPRGFQMALEPQLLHGFVHLLEQAMGVAQWSGPAVGQPSALANDVEPSLQGSDKPQYLN